MPHNDDVASLMRDRAGEASSLIWRLMRRGEGQSPAAATVARGQGAASPLLPGPQSSSVDQYSEKLDAENFAPRCAKTNVTSVAFLAWVWAQRNKSCALNHWEISEPHIDAGLDQPREEGNNLGHDQRDLTRREPVFCPALGGSERLPLSISVNSATMRQLSHPSLRATVSWRSRHPPQSRRSEQNAPIRAMIIDDIHKALNEGRVGHAAEQFVALRHFLEQHLERAGLVVE
jgi:hypothetical protein